ncbi:unnamed protein product [Spodoptera littoralis]|uniref:F-box domain-containing protein n=1 Tax=Spodoptera littoralis TaxID=7109 RepID=A0A9P0I9T3_SPOLI|nr:unnamed protein product [Spodoptera littoralis]CAH1642703.1 unnamed protein product [Spodoptera littoralis]
MEIEVPSPENGPKQDLNDSGCVQDTSLPDNGYVSNVKFLDLSDDALLYIFKYCDPMTLKAVGYICPRLGALVCDRTLWQRVDARTTPMGKKRVRWMLNNCLTDSTTELKISGYANKFSRCLGIQDLQWPVPAKSTGIDVEHFLLRMWYPHLPRRDIILANLAEQSYQRLQLFVVPPRWPNKAQLEKRAQRLEEERKTEASSSKEGPTKEERQYEDGFPKDLDDGLSKDCKGPQFTFSAAIWRDLQKTCENLTTLFIEYCNIDYRTTNVRLFPKKLKKLSMRGTRCYNLPLNVSYLAKVHEVLPDLEYLDVSECDWFEPASLMTISKLANLTEVYMRDCKRLTECVAYASLSTRYGFRKLRVFDSRGSPLADSEISLLGWLPELEELYCSPPDVLNTLSEHTHSWQESETVFPELDKWEIDEPEYYRAKSPRVAEEDERDSIDTSERVSEVVSGNSFWSNERRVIVIQPNTARLINGQFGNPRERREEPQPGPAQPGPAQPDPAQPGPAQPGPSPQAGPSQAGPSQPGPSDQPEAGPSKRRAEPDEPNDGKRPRMGENEDDNVDDDDDDQIIQNSKFRCVNFENRPFECALDDRDRLSAELGYNEDTASRTSIGYHLVSDTAIERFGRAANENINYIHLGRFRGNPNEIPPFDYRPDRANLRILSATGYRHITNRSLEHLATAAPHLLHVDFTDTAVTANGVEIFKAIRPNCEVIFGPLDSQNN